MRTWTSALMRTRDSALMRRGLALLLGLLALAGCGGDTRPPIPVLAVVVPDAPGLVELDGVRFGAEAARAEIARRADATRRPGTSSSRLIVRLRIDPGGSQAQADEVVDWCQRAGINLIERVR